LLLAAEHFVNAIYHTVVSIGGGSCWVGWVAARPLFLPLWAAIVSGPPTVGHLIRPKKYPICVLKDELFSDERVALTNHSGY